MAEAMRYVIAIDPGDVHVGWCLGREVYPDLPPARRWDVECEEMTPPECIRRLSILLANFHDVDELIELEWEVVVEEFVLYPGQDQRNVGGRMKTSELIGKIELTCDGWDTEVVRQPASIKKPMRAQLRGRGIRQVGRGTHMRDAELHFWRRVLGP